MVARGFREGWQTSSVFVKLAIIAIVLVVLGMLVVGGMSWFQSRAYEKREAAREIERQAEEEKRTKDEAEKAQLRIEKAQFETRATEAEAERDVYKQLATARRADRAFIAKELGALEVEYAKRKQDVEATTSSLSDLQLRDELCKRFRDQGKPCPE